MSYILEALKKAEAERKGGIPQGAPLLPPFATPSRNPPAWRRPLPWAGLATLAVALACAAWFAVSRDDTGPEAAATVLPVVPPLAAAAREEPALPQAEEREPEQPKEKAAPKSATKKVSNKAPDKQRTQPPAEARPAKAASSEPVVGTLRDLPEQVQREIPSLSVGGYIYSGNKADRSVLINNKLLREGDEVTPGLVLEKMTPSGMVFSYKGYRYRRNY